MRVDLEVVCSILRDLHPRRFLCGVLPALKLTLNRNPPGITCTIGELLVDGTPLTNTLEDLPHPTKIEGDTRIPAGTYQVLLTVSPAAQEGRLWTPDPDFRLPLLMDVPGFEGVRIHAGNDSRDTRGCVLVGSWTGGEIIHNARIALQALMDMLEIATIGRQPIEIEVNDA